MLERIKKFWKKHPIWSVFIILCILSVMFGEDIEDKKSESSKPNIEQVQEVIEKEEPHICTDFLSGSVVELASCIASQENGQNVYDLGDICEDAITARLTGAKSVILDLKSQEAIPFGGKIGAFGLVHVKDKYNMYHTYQNGCLFDIEDFKFVLKKVQLGEQEKGRNIISEDV